MKRWMTFAAPFCVGALLLCLPSALGACHGDDEPSDDTEVAVTANTKDTGSFDNITVNGKPTFASGAWTGTIKWVAAGPITGQTVHYEIQDTASPTPNAVPAAASQSADAGSGTFTISVTQASLNTALNNNQDWNLVVSIHCPPSTVTVLSSTPVHKK